METPPARVLVVEDSEPFRRFICSTLEKRPEFQIVGKVMDGLHAVQKAEELQPDLIVLDIGLPSLNGIEVARRVRKLSSKSNILFVSQESSPDVVQEALRTGARGYVLKMDASRELLIALRAVIRGENFIGHRFVGHDFAGTDAGSCPGLQSHSAFSPLPQSMATQHSHTVGFYSEDRYFLDDLAQFIVTALKAGNTAIVVATASHRSSLLLRLQAQGVNVSAVIEQGRYIPLDAADTLSAFMLDGMPDPVRFLKLLGDLIVTASKAASGERARIAIFGECVHLLWEQGNAEAAIRIEQLGNQLAQTYDVDILCGYSLGSSQSEMDSLIFQRICAEHSAIYSR